MCFMLVGYRNADGDVVKAKYATMLHLSFCDADNPPRVETDTPHTQQYPFHPHLQ